MKPQAGHGAAGRNPEQAIPDDFAARGVRFAAKSAALRLAQQRVNESTLIGKLVGSLMAGPAWWVSGAPWWAIPVFLVTCGWVVGKIFGNRKYSKLARYLNAEFPELNLP